MQWSIHHVAKLAGTTSRALRHYDDIGLLPPSSIGSNGYRQYDETALVRLQRILMLRDLGLGLPQIGEILDREVAPEEALAAHLDWLRQEQDRLTRQIASVQRTIDTLTGEEQLMAENMFDGFDHTQYQEEVEARWGADAYATGDRWWRGMSADDRAAWKQRASDLAHEWADAARSGAAPDGEIAQALADRHVSWLRSVPGTPASTPSGDAKAYVIGLGEMYVADNRFGANYATGDGSTAGAEFVRDALRIYAEENLGR